MQHMDVKHEDLLAANVLTQDQINWLSTIRIPYNDSTGLWHEKQSLDRLVDKAIKSGVVKPVEREEVKISPTFQVISDDLGVQGILNHADGKKYDSKSQYYKAVKAAGCVVLGNDAPTTCKEPEYKICEKDLKRDIKEAIDQLGG